MKQFIRDTISFCSECGKRILNYGYDDSNPIYKIMKERDIRYECAYWPNFIANPPEHLEIIGGKCYQVLPEQQKTPMKTLGSEGRMHYLLRKNGEIEKSNDVWLLSEVPLKHRDELKDTAWWITKRGYFKLKRLPFQCWSKGCMDRYHCFRYDYRREFNKEGPFNIPPKDWIVGEEHCKEFVNILDIRDYDEYFSIDDILNDDKQFSVNNN